MLKANTGSSVNSDAREAGRESAEKAGLGLEKINLAFVYYSGDYDAAELLAGLRSVWPDVPVIGNTSYQGVILPEGLVGGHHFVGIMALSDDRMTVSAASARNEGDAVETGRRAAMAAMEKSGRDDRPSCCYLACPPGMEESYLKGVGQAIGRQTIFGGSAADNLVMGDWNILSSEGILGDGLAVALFYTDKPATNHYYNGYRPTPDVSVVTKMAAPRRVLEIGGQPIMEHMVEKSGFDPELLSGGDMLVATLMAPMGINDRLSGLIINCHPMHANADGSIDLGCNLSEAIGIIRMETTVAELVNAGGEQLVALRQKMGGESPAAFHLAINFGRAMAMDDELSEAVELIKKAAGNVPFIAEFTLSEFGLEGDGPNMSANLMLSFTGFPK